MLRYRELAVCLLLLLFAGCGGGGGSTPSASTATASPAAAVRLINLPYVSVTVCVPGSGAAPTYSNVLPVVIDSGPASSAAPSGTLSCQTVDHVLVDTGSTGLRLFASVLNTSLRSNLIPQTIAGTPLAECTAFATGVTWGSVKLADVYLSGEAAANLPVQVIADPAYPNIPASCSGMGAVSNTVQSFGANGIIGVNTFAQDCGTGCQSTTNNGFYYSCTSASSCAPTAVSIAKQVANPVAMLAQDNNGILFRMNNIAASGAATATGSLIFGIGTQTNNALGAAGIYDLNAHGNLTTVYSGISGTATFTNAAFLDTGSNALFFPDSGIPACSATSVAPGFYCPGTTLSLSATIQGSTNANSTSVTFNVANADSLFSAAPGYTAFPDIAGPDVVAANFDWGLPFFYGRSVYFALEAPSGPGPYIAF